MDKFLRAFAAISAATASSSYYDEDRENRNTAEYHADRSAGAKKFRAQKRRQKIAQASRRRNRRAKR